jgi:hypothetical protein
MFVLFSFFLRIKRKYFSSFLFKKERKKNNNKYRGGEFKEEKSINKLIY